MSYGKYYSPVSQESDQKDIIIAQLKADIFERRKIEEDYYLIQDELRKMEMKVKRSMDDRQLQDAEYRARNDQALKQIQQLRNEAEQYHQQVRQKINELNDLKEENLKLSEMGDLRALDLQVAKKDFIRVRDEAMNSTEQFERIHEQSLNIDEDARQAQQRNIDLQRAKEDILIKLRDKDRVLQLQSEQLNKVRDMSNRFSEDNQKLNSEMNQNVLEIKQLDLQNHEITKQIRQNEGKVKKLKQDAEIVQVDAQRILKNLQNETIHSQELASRASQINAQDQQREYNFDENKNRLEKLQNSNMASININKQMQEDLMGIRQHIDILMLENSNLLQILEQSCIEDDQIRGILNRTNRFNSLAQKSKYNDYQIVRDTKNQAIQLEGVQGVQIKQSPAKESQLRGKKRSHY